MYGNRGDNPKVRWLSAFEFKRWVSLERSIWPGTSGEVEDELEFDKQSKPTGKFTARVTDAGRHKLVQLVEGQQVSMVPGEDYSVKEDEELTSMQCIHFPDCAEAEPWRHDWVMVCRSHPVAPTFSGCPMPRGAAGSDEKNAKLLMTYFHPWTLIQTQHCEHVPYVERLLHNCESFVAALQQWKSVV